MDNDIQKRIEFINNISIGDVFTRDQLMAIFKISGQSGMMKTNLLNMLVLTTSENNGIYGDSGIENGTIQYTGEGQIGDQTISKNNKTLYYSKNDNIPVYLFSKDNKRRYTFEGRVELYDEPYQVYENDINGDKRLVWKFPLKVIYAQPIENDEVVKSISYEIVEITNDIKIEDESSLFFDASPLELRKYRKKEANRVQTSKKKPDYIAQEILKSKHGELSEKMIFELELQKMMELEAEEELQKMKEFFENKNDTEGYDILSFEMQPDGTMKEIYIEVKSTKGNEHTPIDITENEVEFAKNNVDSYYLYRIFENNDGDKVLKIVPGHELLNFRFVPTTYKIYSN